VLLRVLLQKLSEDKSVPSTAAYGIVKLLEMILAPGNSRLFPDANSTFHRIPTK